MITFSKENERLLKELKKFNSDTYYHSLRVKDLTLKMLNYINEEVAEMFPQEGIDNICKGALLHDIGKLFVKNSVLTKKDCLSSEEKKIIDLHTRMGYEAVRLNDEHDAHKIIPNICLYHHERIDGSGIHHMTVIPFYVQVVSISDVFDALRSKRVYRGAIEKDAALEMIENGQCGAFSPILVKYLREMVKNLTDEPPVSYTNYMITGEYK